MSQPRIFKLVRDTDVTGVSGEGHVADGVEFADGTVVLRWLGDYASTVVWDNLAKAMKVHSHDGRTRVLWRDEQPACAYIAEVIWFEENPVDGRTRIAVCGSLAAALKAFSGHDIYGGDLAATEVTSALGTEQARTWAVHDAGAEPDDEGHRWITEEKIAAEDIRKVVENVLGTDTKEAADADA